MRKTVMQSGVNVSMYHGAACPCPTCTPGLIAGRNYDYPVPYQGRMAKQQLAQIAASASALDSALQDNDRLPAWVQYKIATGEDRVRVATDYMLARIKDAPDGTPYGAAEGGGGVFSHITSSEAVTLVLKSTATAAAAVALIYGAVYAYKRLA